MGIHGVVYLIWNMLNGKKYVGQTKHTVEERFNNHAYAKTAIGNAIRKYGKINFRYGVIKSCKSREEMDYWEKYFIAVLHCKAPYGYNLTDGGEGVVGCPFTPEHCAKISASKKGKKNKPRSPEHCLKISELKKGKKRSPETCAKIAESLKGERNPNYGRQRSLEHCAKISAAIRRESLYKNLIAEINAHNLSYAAIAKILGFSSGSTVSAKMLGKANFTDRDKAKFVEIFGKPIEYLLQRDE